MEAPTIPNRLSDGVAWSERAMDRSVNERFAEVVEAVPERVAVGDTSGRELTYRRLAEVSNGLATAILSSSAPGAKVGLLSDLGIEAITGLLGITAAGCAYVPVDSTEQPARAGKKLVDSGAKVIVVPPGLESLAKEMAPDCEQLVVDIGASASTQLALPDASPDAHFNLIYTSGSTGKPKGVIQNHHNVVFDTGASTALFPIGLDDRFGLVIPLTFGASVSDVTGALLNGARLDLFNLKSHGVDAMAAWMRDTGITVTHLVPTIMRRWLTGVEHSGHYPEMRLIKAGGEPLFRSDLELFADKFDDGCLLRNGLGTTETYLIAAAFFTPDDQVDASVVPVGEAAPGRTVSVVGEDGKEVAEGEVGEILVASPHLSPGYWNDPESTDASFFTPNDGERTYRTGDLGRIRPDGLLEHLGRVDDMVKVMGQRVHLTDVENAISEVEGVIEASVVAKRTRIGDTRLVAYVVADEGYEGSASARAWLSSRLPIHMVPARFVELDTLPTLPFGKVDRRALAGNDDGELSTDTEYRPPSEGIESILASAAAAALGVERVGMDDDLFTLGLDSLSAVQLVARARPSVGGGLAVADVFEHPSIAALSEAVQRVSTEISTSDLDALLAEMEAIGESGARDILDSGRL